MAQKALEASLGTFHSYSHGLPSSAAHRRQAQGGSREQLDPQLHDIVPGRAALLQATPCTRNVALARLRRQVAAVGAALPRRGVPIALLLYYSTTAELRSAGWRCPSCTTGSARRTRRSGVVVSARTLGIRKASKKFPSSSAHLGGGHMNKSR